VVDEKNAVVETEELRNHADCWRVCGRGRLATSVSLGAGG
jgi:hypothetical protein